MDSLPLLSLSELQSICQSQIASYKKDNREESLHCLEIVKRAIAGDSSALDIVLDRFCSMIAASTCPSGARYLLEDITQEVRLKILERFGPHVDRPLHFNSFRKFYSYVKQVVKSQTNELLRKNSKESPLEFVLEEVAEDFDLNHFVRNLELDQRLALIRRLFACLTPMQRAVVTLRHGFDTKPKELQAELRRLFPELPAEEYSVNSQLDKALRKLRDQIKFISDDDMP